MKLSVLVLLVVTVICVDQTLSLLPGFQVRLTQKGLDYGNTMAQRYLSSFLKTFDLPDFTKDNGNLHYRVSGFKNKGITVPTSKMTFAPSHNGLSWSLSGLEGRLFADWNVKYKLGWFKFSVSGSVDADLERSSIEVTLRLGQSGGRPHVSMTRCWVSIGDIDLEFHGGTSFVLNMFSSPLERALDRILNSKLCEAMKDKVIPIANEKLNELKVDIELDSRFLLDYSLIQTPSIQSTMLETYHKGEVFWKNDVKEAPFSPKPIPPLGDQSRMLYMWATDYLANTALTNAQTHKYLEYEITKKDLSAQYQSFLNATCKDICIGSIIKQIGLEFPYSQVVVSAKSHQTPTVKIAPQGITLTANADLILTAIRATDKTSHKLVALNLEANASVVGSVVKERFTGRITSNSFKFNVTESPIGTVRSSDLNRALSTIINYVVVPWANRILTKGVDIPLTGIVDFKNTQVTLLDGVAVIATDLYYQGNF